jgi:hypothetical protein
MLVQLMAMFPMQVVAHYLVAPTFFCEVYLTLATSQVCLYFLPKVVRWRRLVDLGGPNKKF